jgi:uncharacterized protein
VTDRPQSMTVTEAGRRGGNTVKEKYGSDFYRAIGKKGGDATKAGHDADYYREIGTKGGQKGGQATVARYGHTFYATIGKKGGAKVSALIAAGKKALDVDRSLPGVERRSS